MPRGIKGSGPSQIAVPVNSELPQRLTQAQKYEWVAKISHQMEESNLNALDKQVIAMLLQDAAFWEIRNLVKNAEITNNLLNAASVLQARDKVVKHLSKKV